MEALFVEQGLQKFRGRQVMKWIYHRQQLEFSQMTDLPVTMRMWLAENASLSVPEIVQMKESTDGTVKWLINAGNDNIVETVLIPDKGRNTLCVSSQIGCLLDCKFCSNGQTRFQWQFRCACHHRADAGCKRLLGNPG